MLRKILLMLFAAILFIGPLTAHAGFGGTAGAREVQERVNHAQGADYTVTVATVLERTTAENRVVYQITYSYEFKGRSSVYVKGIGSVPPKGEFSYMTSEPLLEFRESAAGAVITVVQLEETIRTMGSDSTEFPEESRFPAFFRSGSWTPPTTFPGAASSVIQKYFPSGYNARQTGQVSYLVTTYRNLEIPNPGSDVAIQNLRSQIAIILSQPYDSAGNRFNYHIQFVARDRPRMSSTWRYGDDRNSATITAAQEFINKLVTEMNAAGGTR